jgi:hypothetical protein
MKKFNSFYLLILLVAIVSFSSCKKEEGCTDPTATSYNSEAEVDNGSCQYEGEVVFWYGSSTSQGLIDFDSNSLTFYVDGVVVGSTSSSVFWTAAPNCGDNASITVTENLGNVKSRSLIYSVEDQDGYELWSDIVNFEANTCEAIELVW